MRHHRFTALLRLAGMTALLAVGSTAGAKADHAASTPGELCTESALRLDEVDVTWSQRAVRGGGGGRVAAGKAGGGRAYAGKASATRGTVARGNRTNVNRNTNVNVRRTNVNVVTRPVRVWGARPYYGTIVGGVALGTVIAVAAANAAPTPPAPGLCWYWSDSSKTKGYWDYC